VGLVLPRCTTEGMSLHLAEIAQAVAPGAHALVLVDQAGWHQSKRLVVPDNLRFCQGSRHCPVADAGSVGYRAASHEGGGRGCGAWNAARKP
jgi:hypothetical protein